MKPRPRIGNYFPSNYSPVTPNVVFGPFDYEIESLLRCCALLPLTSDMINITSLQPRWSISTGKKLLASRNGHSRLWSRSVRRAACFWRVCEQQFHPMWPFAFISSICIVGRWRFIGRWNLSLPFFRTFLVFVFLWMDANVCRTCFLPICLKFLHLWLSQRLTTDFCRVQYD